MSWLFVSMTCRDKGKWAMRQSDIARHVIGCRVTQEKKDAYSCRRVTSCICRSYSYHSSKVSGKVVKRQAKEGRRRRWGLPFLLSGWGIALGARDGVVGSGGGAMLAAGGGAALGAGSTKVDMSARMGGADSICSSARVVVEAAPVRVSVRCPTRMLSVAEVTCGVLAGFWPVKTVATCNQPNGFSRRASTARLPFALS